METHPFCQQIEIQKFLHENKVQIVSWGPFAEGKNHIFNNERLQSIGSKYDKTIAPLDKKVSSFLDHRDPEMVKWLGNVKLNI